MKVLNSVTSVSVVGDNLSVTKVDGSTNTVTVPYVNKSKYLLNDTTETFSGRTIGELKQFIMNKLNGVIEGSLTTITIRGSITDIINNIASNDNKVINSGSRVTFIITAVVHDNNKFFHVQMNTYGYRSYEFGVQNGVFEKPQPIIYAINGKNVADTWKLSENNELVIDANNTATDQVVIGNTADNYTGSGFKYIFKNGKGNNADIYANKVYADVEGNSTSTKVTTANDINDISMMPTYSFVPFYVNSGTKNRNTNGKDVNWHVILTTKISNLAYQLAIPPYATSGRIAVRKIVSSDNPVTTIDSTWKEIPYADEVVTTTGTSTVTGTLNVPTQATTDNSEKVASTAFVQAAIAAALKAKGS